MIRNIFSSKKIYKRGTFKPKAQIIAVGGGKGGVGKSFISSSLGVSLAKFGFKTIIIDLDLGSANLHTCIGQGNSEKGLVDFFHSPNTDLSDIISESSIANLTFISGCNDSLDIADITEKRKSELMSAIGKTQADFIILDLGAGTHASTLDFFLMAQHHILTVTPNPASIENAYRFIKSSFFRAVKRYEKQVGLSKTLEMVMKNYEDLGVRSPVDLVDELRKIEPVKTEELMKFVNRLNFKLIVNQTRTQKDKNLGYSIQSVCGKYFGIPLDYMGHLEYDNAVWRSLQRRKAFLLDNSGSPNYMNIVSMAKDLAYPKKEKAVV